MLVEFSTFPNGKEKNLSEEVARVIDIIEKSGLPHQTHAMGTLIEGEWDQVMDVIKKCHFELAQTSKRIYTRIVVDDRVGATGRLSGKVASIEEKLGREIRK